MQIASKMGHLRVVETLVANGACVNVANRQSSPLQFACFYGHVAVATFLAENGADATNVETGFECKVMVTNRREAHHILEEIITASGMIADLADLVLRFRFASKHDGLATEFNALRHSSVQ